MARLTDLLVVSDIDGTLLQAGYGIPKENIDAIERFVQKGGRFTVCTGRSVDSVRRYIDWIPLTAPAILNNGALIYDYKTETVLYNAYLDKRFVRVIESVLEMFPDVGVEFHSTESITIVHQNEYTHNHVTLEHIPFVLADWTSVKGKYNKALFTASAPRIQQVIKFIEKKMKEDPLYLEFDFIASSSIFFEIIPKGVNKGTGLVKLAEIMKVKMADTVAIGDYYNDVDMLRVAGYKAAVADAPAEIRSNVDATVKGCLQGGVGELLDSLESLCDGFVQLKLDL